MIKKVSKKKKIDFLLLNKEYQRLHLILYVLSAILITLIYFLLILLFSSYYNKYIIILISFGVGIFLVFQRDRIVKTISEFIRNKEIKEYKRRNKIGLKKTLKKITPEKKKKIEIKEKISIKDKINSVKSKFKKKDQKKGKKDYIEIK